MRNTLNGQLWLAAGDSSRAAVECAVLRETGFPTGELILSEYRVEEMFERLLITWEADIVDPLSTQDFPDPDDLRAVGRHDRR